LGGFSSPANLKLTTIGDWLKAVSPLSRVVSFSLKDRSAVLMGGHHADVVCWYSKSSGKFVSSSYYGQHLPEFIHRFNESNFVQMIPDGWEKDLSDCDAMTSPDSMHGEKVWIGQSTAFPHLLPEKSKKELLPFTPFGDSLVLVLAIHGINDMKLGQRESPDLLCLGLSCTDYIGHYYGPNSVEMCNQIKSLDKYLGKFFENLDNQVGKDNYIVVLTSDHSVRPLPEYSTQYMHKTMHRLVDENDVKPAIDRADSALRQELHVGSRLIDPKGFLEYRTAAEFNITPAKLEKETYKILHDVVFVRDIFFRREFVGSKTNNKLHFKEFQRSFFYMNGPDFLVDYKDEYLVTEKEYPAHHSLFCENVPLIIWSNKLMPFKLSYKVYSIDIAPTIAKLLGVAPPPWIDGTSLKEVTHEVNREF
jgi:predicted AlkP superfamily pyrophosphatase or phosphodiesterase